ncbi:hypothetical protein F25303_1313 [Fusarium sp. NRRL 25303]|nr:hypothetical protein F25303_1313 [Fusarium sp. NRRL 25303]
MRCQCHLAGGALSNILAIHIPLRQNHFMFFIVKTHEEGEDIRKLQAFLEAAFPGCIPTILSALSPQPRLGIFLQSVDSLILNLFSHSIAFNNISKKHIAVDVGHLPKVYDGWETARFEDDRYPYTRFKGFDNLEEGEEYTNDPYRIAGPDWLDTPLRTDYIITSSPQSSSASSCRHGSDGTSRSPLGLRSWLEPRRVSTSSAPSPAQSGSPVAPRYDTTSELHSGSDSTGVYNPAAFPRLSSVPISEGSGRSQENIPNFTDLGPGSRNDPLVISDFDGSDIA